MKFRVEDPIEELLDSYLETKNKVTNSDVIRGVLQVPPHMQETSHSRRVSELMRARGWVRFQSSKKGKNYRGFKRPDHWPQVTEQGDY